MCISGKRHQFGFKLYITHATSIRACCTQPTIDLQYIVPYIKVYLPSKFRKSSGRWALVSFVLLVISCFFFFGLALEDMPWTSDLALLWAVLVAGFIPFFWRSLSMSSISRGNSIPRNSSLRSSSTLMGTLGSFG